MNKIIYGITETTDEANNNRIDALEQIKTNVFERVVNKQRNGFGYDSVTTYDTTNPYTNEEAEVGTDPRRMFMKAFGQQNERSTASLTLGDEPNQQETESVKTLIERSQDIEALIEQHGRTNVPSMLLGIHALGKRLENAEKDPDKDPLEILHPSQATDSQAPAILPVNTDDGIEMLIEAWDATKQEITRDINHQNAPDGEIAPENPLRTEELTEEHMEKYGMSHTSICIFTDIKGLPETITSESDYEQLKNYIENTAPNEGVWIAPGSAHF